MPKKPTRMKSKFLLYTLLFIGFSLSYQQSFAQGEEDYCYVSLQLKSSSETMTMARFFAQARKEVKVEFTEYIFRGGQSDFGKRYPAYYNEEKDLWTTRVPRGIYQLRTQHIGFNSVTEIVELKAGEMDLERQLKVDSLPYCYENGKKFDYIRGGIEFSESILVYFRSGDPAENKAYLEETFTVEKVQKMRYTNGFILTLSLMSQVTLAEILYRQALGDELLPEGYYFGDAITKVIETLQYNPNINYANPTYIFPKDKVEVLKTTDFSTLDALLANVKDRKSEQPKKIHPDDFEKSDALKQKLLKKLEEE